MRYFKLAALALAAMGVLAAAGLPATVDPELSWASYMGGQWQDYGYGIAVDSSGNRYITGSTVSSDFPTPGGFDTAGNGGQDAFVAKVTPEGRLAWASYLGGNGNDAGQAIAVDRFGDCYIVGYTGSPDLPTNGGFDTTYNGGADFFVAKVTSSGELVWSSYLGGTGDDRGYGIAVDSTGNCYVAGYTESPDFPATEGMGTSYSNGDAVTAKVTPEGQLAWAQLLGGSSRDRGYAVTVDSSGDCYVTGYSNSSDFPTPGGYDTTLGGYQDAFVAELSPSGALDWASFIGGSSFEEGYGIAVGRFGDVYVTGITQSTDLATQNAFDTTRDGDYDAFLARVPPSRQLEWATYIGGSDYDRGNGVAVDGAGNCYVAGYTYSPDFPATGGFDNTWNGDYDAIVAEVTPAGHLAWASFLGGSDADAAGAIAVQAPGFLHVTGWTESTDLPTPGGFDTSHHRLDDAFAAMISPRLRWLEIDKFQMGLPERSGHDSFVLQGRFNLWPDPEALPETMTLKIGDWSFTVDASAWDRVGKSNVYTFRQAGVSGRIAYWVNGTTKCLFRFNASRQVIQDNLSQLPDVPVDLVIADRFDETLTASMSVKNHVARMSSVKPLPLFEVQSLKMTTNRHARSRDSLSLGARVLLPSPFDPASDGVTVSICGYAISLPAGTLPAARKGVIRYSARAGKGSLKVTLNVNTGTLHVTATGIDLSAVAQAARVSLTIDNHDGAKWDYGVFASMNRAGTLYKY